MDEKMKLVVESITCKIKVEQKNIDRYVKEIRTDATTCQDHDLVTLLPNMIAKLKEAMERKAGYEDQLRLLQFIQK